MKLVRKYYCPDAEQKGKKESETKPEEQPVEEESSSLALAKALKEQQENSVSKEEYEKLRKENKELVAQIINGEGAGNGQTPPPEEADIDALREKLYGPKSSELTNLEYCEIALQLRRAVIERDGVDPFLPHGANIKPTEYDAQRAEAVAQVIQECIDEADGDAGVFTALLQSKINNDSPALTAHLKKMGLLK